MRRRGLLACAAFFFVIAGCAARAPARASAASIAASNLQPPPGTTLEQACTPTGPELCFNAVDDNCNGVIDEGCGLETGLLQFTIAWAGGAEVDLAVVAPGGERVPDGSRRSTASGFHLDRDCPHDGCGGQNVENVYFDGAEPPRGRYVVEMSLGDLHGATPPIAVRFGARIGPRTVGFAVALTPGAGARKELSFDL